MEERHDEIVIYQSEDGLIKRNAATDYSKVDVPPYELPDIPQKPKTAVAERKTEIVDYTFNDVSDPSQGPDNIDDIFKENKAYIEKLEKQRRESEQMSIETDAPRTLCIHAFMPRL